MSASQIRRPAVAGSFYPSQPDRLRELASALLEAASQLPDSGISVTPAGLLVPHAGLVYSGVTAAAAWRTLNERGAHDDDAGGAGPLTVVFLGTNHMNRRLDGVAVWDGGEWDMPTGAVGVDRALAAEIAALGGPFTVDLASHVGEHSIEVQLPLLMAVAPSALIVPLAVSAGTGDEAIDAGELLGGLLADRRDAGERIVLVISSDMAHYPPAAACERATNQLLPLILATDGFALAAQERALVKAATDGLACGMCGIEPAVLGLSAFRAMGATHATTLAASTSADAGGAPDRTVGYLAVRFDTPID
jgi:AmmeMemoRadiSam system protein B